MAHPTWRQRLLFRALPSSERDQMQDDMLELWADRRAKFGVVRATVWLWLHTVLLAVRLRWDGPASTGRLNGILLDGKQAVRGLRASRTFTIVAVVSLAVGIGANVSIYSVIRTLLLDEMAVPAPEELSLVYWHQPGQLRVRQTNSSGGLDPATGLSLRSNFSYPVSRALLEAMPEGTDAFAFNFLRSVAIAAGDLPAVLAGGMAADAGYFRVLAPSMALGRPLGDDDGRADAPAVVVLSYAFHMRVFGGDPSVLGRTIRVNNVPMQVVGVTAAGFTGLSKGGFFPPTEVTVPIRQVEVLYTTWVGAGQSLETSERHLWVRLMTRVPSAQMRDALPMRLASVIPPFVADLVEADAGPPTVVLRPGAQGLDQTRPETRRLLLVLMGVVVVVLLIACVNLAGLMLARGVARQREMAVRRALGAGRFRLVRALVLEGLLLAVAGGAGGLLLTYVSRRGLTTLLTSGLGTSPLSNQVLEVAVDLPLIAATFGVSVIAALFFSLLSAIPLTASGRATPIKHNVVGALTPKLTLGRALVAIQIGVSVPLLVTAVLFLRTVSNLGAVEIGFNPEGIAFFKVDPAAAGVPDEERAATFLRLLNQVQAVPGVTSATLVENAFLSGVTSNTRTSVDGVEHNLYMNAVGPGLLETMGVTLLAGRVIGIQDGPGAPRVGVINETGAREFFGEESPVGRSIPWQDETLQIIGVVRDTQYASQRNPVEPTLFDSALQRSGYGGHNLMVKSQLPLTQLEPALRQAVADVNPGIPVPTMKTQIAQMDEAMMRERVFAQLLTIFGGFALLLVSIGLHGVTSYSVERRTNEIGVRMALGAQPQQVLWLVQRQVVVLAAIGLVIGVPAALAAAPLFGALLFGVAPADTSVLAIGVSVMLAVALVAGWIPARRAARVDPLAALRTE